MEPTPKSPSLVAPALLPCSIPPGSTTFNPQLWDPQAASKPVAADSKDAPAKTVTAYFRGRKLLGREVQLPEGYRGVIPDQRELAAAREARVSATKGRAAAEPEVVDLDGDDDDDDDGESGSNARKVELPQIEARYNFRSITVLGHEEEPAADLPALRAINEWADLARTINQV